MKIFEFELKVQMKVVAEDVQSAMEGVFDCLPMEAVKIVEEIDYEARELQPGEAGVILNRIDEDETSDELLDGLMSLAVSNNDDKPN
tara:strand:- start:2119 stop:2379 length:261 start_codon:yes stop_codon:yes gene_type:complete